MAYSAGARDDSADEVERREELRELVADLGKLPESQRAALVLSELEALSHAQIAQVLQVDTAKVRSLVFQARGSLISTRDARDTPCGEIRFQLSTLTGSSLRRRTLRRHVRACAGCREFEAAVRGQQRNFALILPVTAGAGLRGAALQSAFGGAAAGSGAAAAGGLAAGGAALAGGAAAGGAGNGAFSRWSEGLTSNMRRPGELYRFTLRATTIRFPNDLWEQLEQEARTQGISVAQYVRDAALYRVAYSAAGARDAGKRPRTLPRPAQSPKPK